MGTDVGGVPDRPRDEHFSFVPEHALWYCIFPINVPSGLGFRIVDEEFSDRTMAQVLRAPYHDSQEFETCTCTIIGEHRISFLCTAP